MEEEETITEALPEPVRGPSAVLAEAREKMGLSQKDVADKLYLTTSFIRYIDEGNFDRIPKPAFIKGYLRSYARVVELSGDLVVELYEQELAAVEPATEMKGVTDEKVGTAHITGPVLQTGLIGLVALIVVIALIWWLVSDDEEEPGVQVTMSQPASPEVTPSSSADFEYVIEAGEQQVDDSTAGPAQMQFEAAALAEAESETDESGDEPVGAPEVAEDPVSIERNHNGDLNHISVDAGGFDQLDFTFADECWVEVHDGRHGLVYHDLNRENDVLTVYGTLPFKLLLGKATSVEMIYNGRPFDLEPYIGQDQIAKLTISK